jgi:hypothetical protein
VIREHTVSSGASIDAAHGERTDADLDETVARDAPIGVPVTGQEVGDSGARHGHRERVRRRVVTHHDDIAGCARRCQILLDECELVVGRRVGIDGDEVHIFDVERVVRLAVSTAVLDALVVVVVIAGHEHPRQIDGADGGVQPIELLDLRASREIAEDREECGIVGSRRRSRERSCEVSDIPVFAGARHVNVGRHDEGEIIRRNCRRSCIAARRDGEHEDETRVHPHASRSDLERSATRFV